jgi:UDPglucose 6-dehydrogenase
MRVCVAGLWHLGSVTAACLASRGHRVIGLDPNPEVVAGLQAGKPPLFEPGLAELIVQGITSECLSFTSDAQAALNMAEVVWVTYDTPVDVDDLADVDSVVERVRQLSPYLAPGTIVLISSQLVAGCTRRLQEHWDRDHVGGERVEFAYSPENLRLGNAIDVFQNPDRIVVGVNGDRAKKVIERLLGPLHQRIVWMSVDSAEMTKHAINAFLAMSVSFANEVASICEQVGADAKEVEMGLKSEQRIGPRAYLAAGAAFAGGTLARDVQYLRGLAKQHEQPSALLSAIKESNDLHRKWTQRKLSQCMGTVTGRRVAVLGLTYKPGTDTLRRSASVELCRWLIAEGAIVTAHDPRVTDPGSELPGAVRFAVSAVDALQDAEAAVVATQWPEYQTLTAEALTRVMRTTLIIDSNRFLAKNLDVRGIAYHAVGTPARQGS